MSRARKKKDDRQYEEGLTKAYMEGRPVKDYVGTRRTEFAWFERAGGKGEIKGKRVSRKPYLLESGWLVATSVERRLKYLQVTCSGMRGS